jgi:GNAT superfamily N-acetyltransferase
MLKIVFVGLVFFSLSVQASNVFVTLATPEDYAGCIEVLLANRGFYEQLMNCLGGQQKHKKQHLAEADASLIDAQKPSLLPVARPDIEIMVARNSHQGPIVGLIIFHEQKRPSGNVLVISRFNVREEVRKRGVGRALFSQVFDFCQRHPDLVAVEGKILANNDFMLYLSNLFGFKKVSTTAGGAYVHVRAPLADFLQRAKSLV